MSKFKEDVQLLVELQNLIDEAEKTANPTPTARLAMKTLGAKVQQALPEAQKMAARRIDILTRAKARLEELMENDHEGGH